MTMTRATLMSFVLSTALNLVGCGSEDVSRTSAVAPSSVDFWEEIAPTCGGYPSKGECEDGDMALFGGLLCASGDERGCDLVRDAQSPSGRWWRSPRRRAGNLGVGNSFSRDMSMGVLLYLAKTRDRGAAVRWVDWIEQNRACVTYKPVWLGGGCLVRGPYRFCTDDADTRCTVSPNNWALMAEVWEELGLPLNNEMRSAQGVDRVSLPIQASQAPHGYESHLVAVEAFLKQTLRVDISTRQRVADILADRQPGNPFYVYLSEGPSQALWQRTLDICPSRTTGIPARQHQWAWERDTSSQAWENSSGWDCIFMANLLR